MAHTARTFFSCPFPVRESPDAGRAREEDGRWQREFGLIRSDGRAAQVDAWRTDLLMARTYPLALGDDLVLATNFCNYFFNLDDQFDGALGRLPGEARRVVQPLVDMVNRPPENVSSGAGRQPGIAVVTQPRRGWTDDMERTASHNPAPGAGDNDPAAGGARRSPAVAGFADLWHRLAAPMTTDWCDRFAGHLTRYLRMYAWEAQNRALSRVPDLDTYIQARRPTSAVGVFLILAERLQRHETPPEIWYAPEFLEMFTITVDHVSWTNDVFALERESSRNDVHNIVFSLQKSRGCTQDRAVELCRRLVAAHVERFMDLKQQLPSVHQRIGLTETGAKAADTFVHSSMESWMSGNIDWAFLTGRYDQQGEQSLASQEEIFR